MKMFLKFLKNTQYQLGILFFLVVITFSSCVSYKKVVYFNDIKEIKSNVNIRVQKRIAPFDNLYIKVLSTDEKTSKIFNISEGTQSNATANMLSYLVDENGNIHFPFAGDIKVKDLTLAEACVAVQKSLSDYISNTSVIVKFIDNKITVLGEVQRTGVYNFTDDKVNIYQAIALAGGLTRYGDHKKIVLVRQEDKEVKHYVLDVSNSKIAGNDKFYLLPNDIIIVEPLKAVSRSYQDITYTTILTTVGTVTTALFIIYQISRNR